MGWTPPPRRHQCAGSLKRPRRPHVEEKPNEQYTGRSRSGKVCLPRRQMASRSDRRARVPITSVAPRSRAIDWLPARDFPSWPGRFSASTSGPEIRLQSTYAVQSPLALKGVKSRYACYTAPPRKVVACSEAIERSLGGQLAWTTVTKLPSMMAVGATAESIHGIWARLP